MKHIGLHLVLTALLGGGSTALIMSVPPSFIGVAIGVSVTVSYFLGHSLRD